MSVIGNQPGQASQRIPYIVNVTTTTATFTVPNGYMLGYLDVLVNGVDMVNGDDFTASDGLTFTLTVPAVAGDTVKMVTWIPRGLSDGYTKAEHDARSVYKDSATGSAQLPAGTTAQRPSSPVAGMTRFNTDLGYPEFYSSFAGAWIPFSSTGPYSVEYLVVAGGGGGQGSGDCCVGGGGGGAGGYRSSVQGEMSGGGASAESVMTVTPGASYTVIVGAGGTATGGSNSTFNTITSIGGGRGAAYSSSSAGTGPTSGGSGGGMDWYQPGRPASSSGASGTTGQGYVGGDDSGISATVGGGGGGGAGGAGIAATASASGIGGVGVSSSISGTATYRAGGGGGGVRINFGSTLSGGAGGNGGGGTGSNSSGTGQTSGSANTGGGGGAGSGGSNPNGYTQGGSGVVIIRYTGAQRGSGGTVTFANGYTVHTFTTSGTFTYTG